jgi:hypothetical protein
MTAMQRLRRGALLLLFLASMPPADPQEPLPLARFQEKIRQDLAQIPNYTCLETIERYERGPHGKPFNPVDTVRLEVSNVDGKELFAWPGARRFEDRDIADLVSTGAMGTGMFALFAHMLFDGDKGVFRYKGEEELSRRRAVRYDFRVAQSDSAYKVTSGADSAIVAAKGSVWFDPVSLDLIRLDGYGDAMPFKLHLEEALLRIDYARRHIGNSDALLPEKSEMALTYFSGEAHRNVTEFSECRAYRSESTISFEPPPESLPAPKPPVREVDLPAGLVVPVELETAVDSKTASVGDPLRARVLQDIRYNGDSTLPVGAVITGHIRNLDRRASASQFDVGIEFSEVEWPGARAKFYGELLEIDRRTAGKPPLLTYFDGQRTKVAITNDLPGVGIFHLSGARFHIAPGLHMVWRTLGSGPGSASALQFR